VSKSALKPPTAPASPAAQLTLGTTFVLAGQLVFVLSGYVLHYFLSRRLDAAAYGTYGLVMSVLTWTEGALNSGIPWAVRKFLASRPEAAPAILSHGLRWQMAMGIVILGAAAVLAPPLSASLGDRGLALPLQIALVDVLFMALYTLYRGALNGLLRFAAQGLTMVVYSITKLLSSLLLVGAGLSIFGAIAGNIVGTVGGWLAGAWLLARATGLGGLALLRRPTSLDEERAILRFALPGVLFTLSSQFVTALGPLAVKGLVRSDVQVAQYSAASYLASAPNVLLVAFSFTLFPHLAASIARGANDLTRTYVRTAVRNLALVLAPGAVIACCLSSEVITLLYPASFAPAGTAFSLLFVATGLASLYMVFANAILAEGRVGLALGLGGMYALSSLGATLALTERWGTTGAAGASAVAAGLAALLAGLYVNRRFGASLPWHSLVRIGTASAAVLLLLTLLHSRAPVLIPWLAASAFVYLAALLGLREVGSKELRGLREALRHTVTRQGGKVSG
jgi:O-antigen/teichoic acid export membrane protein